MKTIALALALALSSCNAYRCKFEAVEAWHYFTGTGI